uniref:Uncharacterized protein n=1 Tax=Ditylum brightwellii TaxID=49249 RepID=A0A7S4T890_9STRA|mmetsp:Transcript_6129/g.8015  ORF Transcript_6129/g.8015 Transcript_6129/m.8015 type:complete len:323 (+) Transcript_6129:289-1257(+)
MSRGAVQCGELEVEIYKLRRQVERARNKDDRHTHHDHEIASELTSLREEVDILREEHAKVAEEDAKIQAELCELSGELQNQISLRDQYSMDIDLMQCEVERFELEILQRTAETEQLLFYQQEMDIMVQKLRMNVQHALMEKEQEEITVRNLGKSFKEMKESLNSQMELHDVMLKPQIDQIIREKNEMKFKAQTLSFQNDELQEEVEGLGGWGTQDNFSLFFGFHSHHGGGSGRGKKGSSIENFSIHSAGARTARSLVDVVRRRADRPALESKLSLRNLDGEDTCTTVDEDDVLDQTYHSSPIPKDISVETCPSSQYAIGIIE